MREGGVRGRGGVREERGDGRIIGMKEEGCLGGGIGKNARAERKNGGREGGGLAHVYARKIRKLIIRREGRRVWERGDGMKGEQKERGRRNQKKQGVLLSGSELHARTEKAKKGLGREERGSSEENGMKQHSYLLAGVSCILLPSGRPRSDAASSGRGSARRQGRLERMTTIWLYGGEMAQ